MTSWDVLPTGPDDLGEGPIWSPDGALWRVDITGRAVYRLDVATGEERRLDVPSNVGSIAPTARGDLLACLAEGGIHRLDPVSGALEPLVDPEQGGAPTLNDGRCDAAGRFWCGTCDPEEAAPLGALFRLDVDGSVHRMAEGLIVSNGIDWSLDGRVLYHTDSGTGTITAYDHDPATGAIERPHVFVRDEDGVPDGLVVDAEGCVWSAKWDGWRIVRYTPDGEVERTLAVPVQRPTAIAFGGPDLRTLYVTTARYDLTPADIVAQPHAGRTLVRELDVAGRPTVLFGG